MTTMELLIEGLKRHGYDGLFNSFSECACLIADLAPCGELHPDDCQPGYLVKNCKCHEDGWHIQKEKP